MFLFCKSCLIIVILLNLILILNSVTVAQNIVRAQATENGTYPYQAPLFATLDDREDTNTEEQKIETEMIRQNSTLSYNSTVPSSYSSDNQSSARELLLSANQTKVADSYQDSRFYDASNTSGAGSFYLGDVQFTHYRINVNGISMHYVKGGEGDPVVLLHGWPKTWYEWRYVMPILVKNNYTVIVPDLRGLGDTSKSPTGYDGKTTAEDIYQLVSQLGFKQKIFLVGHDIGAQTAYSYTVAHPNVVKKLGIISFVFPGSLPNKNTVEPWWVAFHKVQDLPESLLSGNEREYLSWFYRQLAYNPYSITEQDIDEYVRQYSAPGGMRAGFEYFRAFPSDIVENNQALNSPPDVPTLAVSGEFSGVGIQETEDNPTMESIRKLAKNVTGVLIPLSGHWIPEEQPRLLAELLVSFFKENDIQSQSYNDTKSLIYSDIIDQMYKIDNTTLSPASEKDPQARNLSDAMVANQNRSVISKNFSNIQEWMQQQQQQTTSHPSVDSVNKTNDNQLNQYDISRGQESSVTIAERQKNLLLANQTNTTKNVMEGEIIVTNLTDNGTTDKQQISDDNPSDEQLAEQETLSSAAAEAIGRIIDGRGSE